jgi:hypothetical protein
MNQFNPYQPPQSTASVAGKKGQLSRPVLLLLASVGLAVLSLGCFVGSALLMQNGPSWQPAALRLCGIGLLGVGVMLLVMAAVEHGRQKKWK